MIAIRHATLADLPAVMEAYDHGRALMRAQGNATQWVNGYPTEELARHEIAAGHSFLCVDEADRPLGTFCLIHGEEPTYRHIEQGTWLNDGPYATLHRLATNGRRRGVGKACLDWCATRCANLRVDTHSDNIAMNRLLEREGFLRCGIIYVADGTPRVAYQKVY
ncbi:MAG: GNAT family N-acetyltransferase [Mediterranea sp.]|jgi:GNAT superfamily N-acetyltransferase|nr:GNAT family N-acetyltransferase [Mediterranea sp.]